MNILSYLQKNKHLSRRAIVQLIKEKKIFLNGIPLESFKQELTLGDEIIFPKGRIQVTEQTKVVPQLLLFNKPKGYVVSKSDPHNTTIYEILPAEFSSRYYIGRLDKESRGLLLLTNTPGLVHQYEHPSFNVFKEYLIQLSSAFKQEDIQKVKVWIHDEAEILKFQDILPTDTKLTYKVILSEGKKRHIRRVIKSLGYTLLDLQRIKEGEYTLWNLEEGKWKLIDLEQ